MLTLVVGFSGCAALDKGIVTVEPSTVEVGEKFTFSCIFKSFEPTIVTIFSIDWDTYLDGDFTGSGTLDPESPGWLTGTVPPFQEVVIYSAVKSCMFAGSWERVVTFHTSEGDFEARVTWTVLPSP